MEVIERHPGQVNKSCYLVLRRAGLNLLDSYMFCISLGSSHYWSYQQNDSPFDPDHRALYCRHDSTALPWRSPD